MNNGKRSQQILAKTLAHQIQWFNDSIIQRKNIKLGFQQSQKRYNCVNKSVVNKKNKWVKNTRRIKAYQIKN